MNNKNILLCGVGGQGTVLASRLLAATAMSKGIAVKTAETIGMSQRGGSVVSHIKIGAGAHSPLIQKGTADMIIGFEPAETVRMLSYLKNGGAVVVSNRPITPVSANIGMSSYDLENIMAYLKDNVSDLTVVDAESAETELGSSKVLNVVLLGAAIRTGALEITEDDIMESIRAKVKPQFVELNERALYYNK